MDVLIAAADYGMTKTVDVDSGDTIGFDPMQWINSPEYRRYAAVIPEYWSQYSNPLHVAMVVTGLDPYRFSDKLPVKYIRYVAKNSAWRVINNTNRLLVHTPIHTQLAMQRVSCVVRWRFCCRMVAMDRPVTALCGVPMSESVAMQTATPTSVDWHTWAVYVIEHELRRACSGLSAYQPHLLFVHIDTKEANVDTAARASRVAINALETTLKVRYINNKYMNRVNALSYTIAKTSSVRQLSLCLCSKRRAIRMGKRRFLVRILTHKIYHDQMLECVKYDNKNITWRELCDGVEFNVEPPMGRAQSHDASCLWKCVVGCDLAHSVYLQISVPGRPMYSKNITPNYTDRNQLYWPTQGSPQRITIRISKGTRFEIRRVTIDDDLVVAQFKFRVFRKYNTRHDATTDGVCAAKCTRGKLRGCW